MGSTSKLNAFIVCWHPSTQRVNVVFDAASLPQKHKHSSPQSRLFLTSTNICRNTCQFWQQYFGSMTYLFDFMENPNHRDSVMLQPLFADELIRNGCSIQSESKRNKKSIGVKSLWAINIIKKMSKTPNWLSAHSVQLFKIQFNFWM